MTDPRRCAFCGGDAPLVRTAEFPDRGGDGSVTGTLSVAFYRCLDCREGGEIVRDGSGVRVRRGPVIDATATPPREQAGAGP